MTGSVVVIVLALSAVAAGPTSAGTQGTFERLHSFGPPGTGTSPYAGVIQGSDGALYGTTTAGGSDGVGTIFRLSVDGTDLRVLKSFDHSGTGYDVQSSLVEASDGALYGTTTQGGANNGGTLFRIHLDGTGFAVIKDFDSPGSFYFSRLTQGPDGALYGTREVGASNGGFVFKIFTDGTGYATIKTFDGIEASHPIGALLQGLDGELYGTALSGYSIGVVYRLHIDGGGFSIVHDFDNASMGFFPYGSLTQGPDGTLYGTTYQGGANGLGTCYRLNPDGSGFAVLANFDSNGTGGWCESGLMMADDGMLYGSTPGRAVAGCGTIFRLHPDGSGLNVIRPFDCSVEGGPMPFADLIQGEDGLLYGITGAGLYWSGAIFRLGLDGSGLTILKSLIPERDTRPEGVYPMGGLTQASDGAFYGITSYGGLGSGGTIFRMSPDGTGFKVIKHLSPPTGTAPYGRLLQGQGGTLYGTTSHGGTHGMGTLFKLNPDGSEFVVLKHFDISTGSPNETLIQGVDGIIYGTTNWGGVAIPAAILYRVRPDGTDFASIRSFPIEEGVGLGEGLLLGEDGALYGVTTGVPVVFKVNTDGTDFSVLRQFGNGEGLIAPPILGVDGALFGTAGGGTRGGGIVYRLNTDGSGFRVLENLDPSTGGRNPHGRLVQNAEGWLYGTGASGGLDDGGTVFTLRSNGSDFRVLRYFNDLPSGTYLLPGLTLGADGMLYGACANGGDSGYGTLFRLTPGADASPVARCKSVVSLADGQCAADVSIDDGSADPDFGDTVALRQDPPGPYPVGTTEVTLTVTDNWGAHDSASATVTVLDPRPVVTITSPSGGSIFEVNHEVPFAGTWTDENGGPHWANWILGGVPGEPGSAGSGISGSVGASQVFSEPGVYSVQLVVTDECDSAGMAHEVDGVEATVVIYDPNAGLVAGGGWFISPAGACTQDSALAGRVNFSFSSMYAPESMNSKSRAASRVPVGDTNFGFVEGNFDFRSTSYDWLVVGGARAQFAGRGTVNGQGGYRFTLTCTDGAGAGTDNPDRFRIKITNAISGVVAYDNMGGAPDSTAPITPLDGGAIVVPPPSLVGVNPSAGGSGGPEAIPVAFALAQNQPNPFTRSTRVGFSVPERSRVTISLFDLGGRAILTLFDGEELAGFHSATLGRAQGNAFLGPGVYFLRMQARSLESQRHVDFVRKVAVVD